MIPAKLEHNWPGRNPASPDHPMAVRLSDGSTFGEYPIKLVQPLTDGGDSSMARDGSVTPVELSFTRGAVDVEVHRILVSWSDDGNWRTERFAGFGAELSNGCDLEYTRDGVTIPLLDGVPVKNNFDMAAVMFDISIMNLGAGATFLAARYSLGRFGDPIVLREGDSITWRINDDLQELLAGRVIIEGEVIV